MKLYLARHGEAVPKHVDPDAPLSDVGRKGVELTATFLANSLASFDKIYHSGKTRARQTAQIYSEAFGGKTPIEKMDGLNPMDPPEYILPTVNQWQSNTLIVGHLPFMGILTDLILAGSNSSGIAEFETGTVVCLQRRGSGMWSMKWMITPTLLELGCGSGLS